MCVFQEVLLCVYRLQGEGKVTKLIQRVQEYLENKYGNSEPELLCRIYMRRIDHLYYKVRGRVQGGLTTSMATDLLRSIDHICTVRGEAMSTLS